MDKNDTKVIKERIAENLIIENELLKEKINELQLEIEVLRTGREESTKEIEVLMATNLQYNLELKQAIEQIKQLKAKYDDLIKETYLLKGSMKKELEDIIFSFKRGLKNG